MGKRVDAESVQLDAGGVRFTVVFTGSRETALLLLGEVADGDLCSDSRFNGSTSASEAHEVTGITTTTSITSVNESRSLNSHAGRLRLSHRNPEPSVIALAAVAQASSIDGPMCVRRR